VIYLERKRRDEIILLIISREYIPSSLGNIKDDATFESRKLIALPQLGSTDGVDCAVKTEVRGCASDKPHSAHSVYFRNVQNLDTVISYRHITILFVIFVVSSTKFFLSILI